MADVVLISSSGIPCGHYKVVPLQEGKRTILLQSQGASGNLRIQPNGKVDSKGKRGVWARWILEDGEGGASYLRNIGHSMHENKPCYLEESGGGFLMLGERVKKNQWQLQLSDSDGGGSWTPRPHSREPVTFEPDANFLLTEEEKKSFVEQGFIIFRDIVPQEISEDALRAINRGLQNPEQYFLSQNDNRTARLKDSRDAEQVNRLLVNKRVMSKLSGLVSSLKIMDFDEGTTEELAQVGHQVALRFPASDDICHNPPDRDEYYGKHWHVDGLLRRPPRVCPFAMLVGVALSDQNSDGCGNLEVKATSHIATNGVLSRIGQHMLDGTDDMSDFSQRSWSKRPGCERPDLLHISTQPVLLKKGDIVCLHFRTAHSIGLNFSSNLRYQVYFRLQSSLASPAEQRSGLSQAVVDNMFAWYNEDIQNLARTAGI